MDVCLKLFLIATGITYLMFLSVMLFLGQLANMSFHPLLRRKYYSGQASRPISTARLNALLHLHLRPINLVIFEGP